MNVLFPIAEAYPFYKIGGLGDVGGSLPPALSKLSIDIRIALPKHPEVRLPKDAYQESSFEIIYNQEALSVNVYRAMLPESNVLTYLFEENKYLSKSTDASDNHADKFSVFSLAVATWVAEYSPYWQPQVIHCHDWHTSLIPVLLKHKHPHLDYKTIITIHNLAYQGITQTPVAKHLNLNPEECHILSWDQQDGEINIMLEGLLHASHITTVSPQYAKEILTQEYGEKIDAILQTKATTITGILNGIDTNFFNPDKDKLLFQNFSKSTWEKGKLNNRVELMKQHGINYDQHQILISFIGRVDPYQKGIGLIIQAIEDNVFPENIIFFFLGTGDPNLETELHSAAKNKPNIKIVTRFDEPLAHNLYAASHLSLIPSRFEPCGLVQMMAMRYGSLPIARKTGGLADTIIHNHDGFLFNEYNHKSMTEAIYQAIEVVKNQNKLYTTMVEKALDKDFSWKIPATEYKSLYENLILNQK